MRRVALRALIIGIALMTMGFVESPVDVARQETPLVVLPQGNYVLEGLERGGYSYKPQFYRMKYDATANGMAVFFRKEGTEVVEKFRLRTFLLPGPAENVYLLQVSYAGYPGYRYGYLEMAEDGHLTLRLPHYSGNGLPGPLRELVSLDGKVKDGARELLDFMAGLRGHQDSEWTAEGYKRRPAPPEPPAKEVEKVWEYPA